MWLFLFIFFLSFLAREYSMEMVSVVIPMLISKSWKFVFNNTDDSYLKNYNPQMKINEKIQFCLQKNSLLEKEHLT